jgi:hypothetical protein
MGDNGADLARQSRDCDHAESASEGSERNAFLFQPHSQLTQCVEICHVLEWCVLIVVFFLVNLSLSLSFCRMQAVLSGF